MDLNQKLILKNILSVNSVFSVVNKNCIFRDYLLFIHPRRFLLAIYFRLRLLLVVI
jgi:hypothetical protein